MIEIFGDWLMFDGERLASVAHLTPGRRMLLADHLTCTGGHVDLCEVDSWRVMANADDGTVTSYPEKHEGQPALPDGCQILEVLSRADVEDALTKADVGFDYD
jgi:hypothetical protein